MERAAEYDERLVVALGSRTCDRGCYPDAQGQDMLVRGMLGPTPRQPRSRGGEPRLTSERVRSVLRTDLQ